MIKCKEVIVSNLTRRGTGESRDPIRAIIEVYEKDGTLIAEHDPCPEHRFGKGDLISFAIWLKVEGVNIGTVNKWLDETDG